MSKWQEVCYGLVFLVFASVLGWGQGLPPQVLPIPIPGGDVLLPAQPIRAAGALPSALFNQFFPGVGSTFDGLNAEPHGITNFNGHVAMGYTRGTATDNNGTQYSVITDIRVYQGEYIGGVSSFGAGGTTSAKAHGTFVEI